MLTCSIIPGYPPSMRRGQDQESGVIGPEDMRRFTQCFPFICVHNYAIPSVETGQIVNNYAWCGKAVARIALPPRNHGLGRRRDGRAGQDEAHQGAGRTPPPAGSRPAAARHGVSIGPHLPRARLARAPHRLARHRPRASSVTAEAALRTRCREMMFMLCSMHESWDAEGRA